MARPLDYGDQFPSDEGDTPPADPSNELVEADFRVSRSKAASTRLQPSGEFNPYPELNEPQFPDRDVWTGTITAVNDSLPAWVNRYAEESQEPGRFRGYTVLTETGESFECVSVNEPEKEASRLQKHDYVIVVRGAIADSYYCFGTPTKAPKGIYKGKVKSTVAAGGTGKLTLTDISGTVYDPNREEEFHNWTSNEIDADVKLIIGWCEQLETNVPLAQDCT